MKEKITPLLSVLCLICVSLSLHADPPADGGHLYAPPTLTNIFSEDFGSGPTTPSSANGWGRAMSSYMPASSFLYGGPGVIITDRYYAVVAPNYINLDPAGGGNWWTTASTLPSQPGVVYGHTTGAVNDNAMIINAGDYLRAFYQRTVSVTPGATYQASLWLYVVNPSVSLKLELTDQSTQLVLGNAVTPVMTQGKTGWQKITFNFTIPSACFGGARNVIVKYINNFASTSGDDYYVDDLSVDQVVNGTPDGINIGISCTPLPITMTGFSATQVNQQVQLSWTTGSEQNSKGFEIQKSEDGIGWSLLGFADSKAAGGNSNTDINYSYTDAEPFSGQNYYRLRLVDLDGRYQYSEIRSVNFQGSQDISISPNPTRSNIRISGLSTNQVVTIYDMAGRKLLQEKTGSQLQMTLSLSNFRSGTYSVIITTANGTPVATRQVIKER